jgi:hypothetical protein
VLGLLISSPSSPFLRLKMKEKRKEDSPRWPGVLQLF